MARKTTSSSTTARPQLRHHWLNQRADRQADALIGSSVAQISRSFVVRGEFMEVFNSSPRIYYNPHGCAIGRTEPPTTRTTGTEGYCCVNCRYSLIILEKWEISELKYDDEEEHVMGVWIY